MIDKCYEDLVCINKTLFKNLILDAINLNNVTMIKTLGPRKVFGIYFYSKEGKVFTTEKIYIISPTINKSINDTVYKVFNVQGRAKKVLIKALSDLANSDYKFIQDFNRVNIEDSVLYFSVMTPILILDCIRHAEFRGIKYVDWSSKFVINKKEIKSELECISSLKERFPFKIKCNPSKKLIEDIRINSLQ